MRPLKLLVLLALLSIPQAARADDAAGSGALALAALVGNVSPDLGGADKAALMTFLDSKTDVDVPAGTKITVTAGKVACRASNVDITAHSCDLTFGGKTAKLAGRAAHELYATLLEVGVEADPGAGNIWVSVSKLNCAIDVDEVKDKAGGGAKCEYASNG